MQERINKQKNISKHTDLSKKRKGHLFSLILTSLTILLPGCRGCKQNETYNKDKKGEQSLIVEEPKIVYVKIYNKNETEEWGIPAVVLELGKTAYLQDHSISLKEISDKSTKIEISRLNNFLGKTSIVWKGEILLSKEDKDLVYTGTKIKLNKDKEYFVIVITEINKDKNQVELGFYSLKKEKEIEDQEKNQKEDEKEEKLNQ